jgi:SAM-dependent methyltransferase
MDWENQYLINVTPWEKGEPAPPLDEWLERNGREISGRVLVPGCGLGHDCRALAEHSGANEIIGLDISPEAVRRAGEFPVIGTERYEVGDLFDLEPDHLGSYDWVWEHTCFCAIEPGLRNDYVEAVWSALRPGGTLLAVFYLNPYDDEHRPGGGPPHGATSEEIRERFEGSGRFRAIESYIPAVAYEGREGREQMTRFERLG